MPGFLMRVAGAALLDPAVYEDVEADRTATGQAIAVILLGSLATAVGATGWNADIVATVTLSAAVATFGLLAWASWAVLTFEIGRWLLPEAQTRVEVTELLRTIGFSAAPALLLALASLGARTVVFAVVGCWLMASMIVAVRQALDYSTTWRAVAVCLLGCALTFALVIGLSLLFGPVVAA